MSLIGRREECEALDGLVASARLGLSGALVLVGDPGIGKTALLEYATDAALDLRHLAIAGVESEVDFAYAALHRMLLPFLDRLDSLPVSQRDDLAVACGLIDGRPPNPHLVSLATLTLLADVSAQGPMLVGVDDAHWIDRESIGTLAFVGRRLRAEGIALVIGARGGEAVLADLRGLPTREVVGLDHSSAVELLHSVVAGPVDRLIGERVVAATGGNPLALTDLGAELSSLQLVGGVPLPEPLPVGRNLESHYLRLVRALPTQTQTWLLLAACDGTGQLAYVSNAAVTLGISSESGDAAERAGLVHLRPAVTFRHPLIRSAVYGGATDLERRSAHRAMAAVTTGLRDADRRAWHLGAASDGFDEDVAAELERSALRAGARGGYAARASFLAKAAELTANASDRDRRLIAAAESAFTAGALLQARALLERVDADGDDTESTAIRRGPTLMLRASLTVGLGDPGGFAVAPAMNLAAATAFMEHDTNLVREALFRACRQAITAEGLIEGTSVTEIAAAIRDIGAIGATHPDPVLDAFAALATDSYETAVPHLRQAIATLLAPETAAEVMLERYIVGVTYCTVMWDDRSRTALLERGADLARTTGALWNLDSALFARSMAETIAGRLEAADRYVIEGHDIRSALGATQDVWQVYRHPELLAWHGETGHTRAMIQGTAEGSTALGIGAMVSIAKIGLMVLAISEGQYADASAVGRDLMDGEILYVHSRVLPDLVEAAFRSGDQALAAATLESLSIRATASGTPWALGLLARSQALLAADDEAEPIYRRAIDVLGETEAISDLARSHLLYGEWLRRQNRRRDARDELRTAFASFEEMGASGFADRTRTELAATGERARKRSVETLRDLTPQEDQIARLAALGDTNAEIGERLFISATTVDYHLRKVYQKLDIGSRRDLRSRYRAT